MPKKRGSNEEFLNPGARRFRPPEVMPRKLKAAIYVRVSTRYQVDKDSLPFQKEELINYIKYALNIEDYEIFEDAGYSAKNTSRPKFQEMMSRIRNNEFTHLVVYKIDRISRNLLDFAQMYEELQKHNCSFVSKVEQFDTSTAMGEAMTRIVLVFAELERKMTGERVTAIMFSRAEKGLWNGAPIPIGYKWSEEKKYPVVDPEEAKVVRYIFDRYISLESALKVSYDLAANSVKTKRGGEWTSKTVRDVIRNPFYKGTYRYNHKTQTGTEKPLSEQIIIGLPLLFSPAGGRRCAPGLPGPEHRLHAAPGGLLRLRLRARLLRGISVLHPQGMGRLVLAGGELYCHPDQVLRSVRRHLEGHFGERGFDRHIHGVSSLSFLQIRRTSHSVR